MKMMSLHYKPTKERGMDYLLYAEMYKNNVEILLDNLLAENGYEFKVLEECLNTAHGHDSETLPLLFNFRHFLELQLTGLILFGSIISPKLDRDLDSFIEKSRTSHSLDRLITKLRQVEIPKSYLDEEIIKFIRVFDKFDGKSDRFRYPENSKGVSFFTKDDTKFMEYSDFYDRIIQPLYLADIISRTIFTFKNLESYFDIQIQNLTELPNDR